MSGAFTNLLREDTRLGHQLTSGINAGLSFVGMLPASSPTELNDPQIDPLQLAFFRVLFAGFVLLPVLRGATSLFDRCCC